MLSGRKPVEGLLLLAGHLSKLFRTDSVVRHLSPKPMMFFCHKKTKVAGHAILTVLTILPIPTIQSICSSNKQARPKRNAELPGKATWRLLGM